MAYPQRPWVGWDLDSTSTSDLDLHLDIYSSGIANCHTSQCRFVCWNWGQMAIRCGKACSLDSGQHTFYLLSPDLNPDLELELSPNTIENGDLQQKERISLKDWSGGKTQRQLQQTSTSRRRHVLTRPSCYKTTPVQFAQNFKFSNKWLIWSVLCVHCIWLKTRA